MSKAGPVEAVLDVLQAVVEPVATVVVLEEAELDELEVGWVAIEDEEDELVPVFE